MSAAPSGDRRSRELNWHRLDRVVELAASMPGIDYLRGVSDGRLPLPPFPELIGIQLCSVEPGRVTLELTPDESSANLVGVVHGGLTCTLLDVAVGCATQSLLPIGASLATAQINVNFIRPLKVNQPVRVTGETIRLGAGTGFCEAQAIGGDELLANATATIAIRRPPS